jgi:hypothetical protein
VKTMCMTFICVLAGTAQAIQPSDSLKNKQIQQTLLVDSLIPACVGAKNDTTSNMGSGSELNMRLRDNSKNLVYLTK